MKWEGAIHVGKDGTPRSAEGRKLSPYDSVVIFAGR